MGALRAKTLRVHAIVALAAFVCDGFVWGLPLLVFPVGFVGGVLALPLIFSGRARDGVLAVLSYVGALVLAFLVFALHVNGAEARAGAIIRALDAYRSDHGSYPEGLEALTPAYLPRIPRAKDTLWFDDYSYAPAVPGRDAAVTFAILPPLTFVQFSLETRKWSMPDS